MWLLEENKENSDILSLKNATRMTKLQIQQIVFFGTLVVNVALPWIPTFPLWQGRHSQPPLSFLRPSLPHCDGAGYSGPLLTCYLFFVSNGKLFWSINPLKGECLDWVPLCIRDQWFWHNFYNFDVWQNFLKGLCKSKTCLYKNVFWNIMRILAESCIFDLSVLIKYCLSLLRDENFFYSNMAKWCIKKSVFLSWFQKRKLKKCTKKVLAKNCFLIPYSKKKKFSSYT